MGCNRNRLAGSLTARPLDNKKDEETPFNKAARPCQPMIPPQGSPEMGEREGAETSRDVWRWQEKERRG